MRIPLNTLLQVICDGLHRRYIHLIPLLGLDGLLGFFGTEGLAKGIACFKTLQGGNFCRLERLERLDLVSQDVEGCLANRRRLGALVVHRNKIPGRRQERGVNEKTARTLGDTPRPNGCVSALRRREKVDSIRLSGNQCGQLCKLGVLVRSSLSRLIAAERGGPGWINSRKIGCGGDG